MCRPRNLILSLLAATLLHTAIGAVAQEPALPVLFPGLREGPTSTEAGIVNESAVVLQELTSGTVTSIPETLLASAEAIAIVPHFIRGAFVVGVGGGRGVLVQRDANRQWRAPEFIQLFGGSVGWQVGLQATDLVLVFRSANSLQNISRGKITLGVDASAAAGPVGRTAGAATDGALQAEILTYSRSRGLYAGVSLGGSSLQLDVPATRNYYQITPTSPGVVPPSAIALVNELGTLARRISPEAIESLRPGNTAAPTDASLIEKRATTIHQIAGAITALQSKVDAQWQEYLVLPASWRMPETVTAADIQAVVVRYERVATNPQFRALSSQPEFVETLRLLRQLATDAATDRTLQLPPPPQPF